MVDHEYVQPENLSKPIGVWTPAVIVRKGSLVFVSGLTSRDEKGEVAHVGDIRDQTRQICENLRSALRSMGGDLSDVVSVLVHVTDIEEFDAIHEVRREFFPKNPPASTMVQVERLVDERSLIEITAIAALDNTV